jgi:DNA (cytosine-5)-methyltransferase 1
MRPRLLDLFCGAGGAAMGYHRAGFEIVGVDHKPQPRYPFDFVCEDALGWLRDCLNVDPSTPWGFAAIHASPPCQAYTSLRHLAKREHPDLVAETRELLISGGLPYVIENVVGSPLRDPLTLCGSSFGLPLRRHRLFESNVALFGPPCSHEQMPKVLKPWRGQSRAKGLTRFVEVYGHPNVRRASAAMEINWMQQAELAQAIPPAYTELIGHQLMQHIRQGVAAG